MSTFVLVHGGCHGAWCWYKMIPRLEAAGHRVVAPDLPGHGVEHRSAGGLSLGDYAASVESALDTVDEPAILVGHSMGGFVVQLVGQNRPEKVAAIVYLATGAVASGETLITDPITGELLAADGMSSAVVNRETDTLTYPANVAKKIFYGDCDADDIALASMLLVPEPGSLVSTTTFFESTPDRYGRLPRYAIITLNDKAVPTEIQRKLHERDGVTDIFTLPTSHSPFFSQPDALAGHLLDIAAGIPSAQTRWAEIG